MAKKQSKEGSLIRMAILSLVLFALLGTFAGFLGGLLGIGGGLVVVPALIAFFQFQGLPSEHAMQVAVGTSLAAMTFTSFSSAGAHIRKKGVNWSLFWRLAPGTLVGTIFGSWTADMLPSLALKTIFGCLVLLLGIYFICYKPRESRESHHFRQKWLLYGAGLFIGWISSIMGIGGGIVTVPLLAAFHQPLRAAISTSAVIGSVIALVGAIAFVGFGFKEQAMDHAFGYVYVPAFLTIGLFAFLSAPLGAKMAYTWPVGLLSKFFGALLLCEGIFMLG